ncbi:MAG TPA: SprB repeat-containing protein, partial [Salinivirga sp.]|uniref:SprB repeat-containing protein n=1 Tax=Salinivirga sp. TaxID=1970192 RepID=UPI002B468FA8
MRRIILLITSIFLLSTLAAENTYWTNNSGNWIKAGLSSGKKMKAHLNGKIPGKATAHILVGPNTRAAQTDNNERLLAPHQSIATTSNTNLSPAGNKKTQPGVSPQTTKNVMPKGDSNQNNDNQISNQGKKSAQTPDNDIKSGSKAAPTIDSVVVTHASCYDLDDGIIKIYPDDADSCSIDNGATWYDTTMFYDLAPGFYNIIAKKGTDETVWGGNPVEITAPDQLVYDSADVVPVTCHDGSDGEITIYVSGGTPPYTFDAGIVSQTGNNHFTNLNPGKYTFQIDDANDCPNSSSLEATLIVSNPPEFSIDAVTKTNVQCAIDPNGSISITMNGAAANEPYEYRIEGQNTGTLTHITSDASYTFEDLRGDNYDVFVTDANGCEKGWGANPVYISEPDTLKITNVSLQNIIGCAGNTNGEIEITADGGVAPDYYYSIRGDVTSEYQDAPNFYNLSAGTYDIWIKDLNDCKVNYGEVTLTEPDSVEIDAYTITQPTCFGEDGTVEITATSGGDGGPYEYLVDTASASWQPGSTFSLPEGNYDIFARDGNLCVSDTLEVLIDAPDEITYDITPTDPSCFGNTDGTILVDNVAGGSGAGYRYFIGPTSTGPWTEDPNGDGLFENLGDGTYHVYVEDGAGCASNTQQQDLTEPTEITFDVTPTDPSCFGNTDGTILVDNVAGGSGAGYIYFIGNSPTGPWSSDGNG